MRTLLHWAARLYPADWRARYGQELHGLLDDIEPTWQDVLDVAMGGLQMQLGHSVVRLAVVFSIVGVCAAGLVALTLPKQFVARGVVSVRFRQPTAGALMTTTFSSDDLRSLLDARHLFPSNRNQREKKLRGNVLIDRLSNNAVRVSFAYPDAVTAQQVTRDLEIMIANNTRARTEHDISTVVYEEPNVPRTAERPNRVALVAIGLLGGGMLGVLAAFIRRARPSV